MGLFGKLFGKRDKAVALSKIKPGKSRIPTLKFDQSRITSAVEAEVRSILQGIPEIEENKFASAYDAALQSVRAGRNLKILQDALVDLGLAMQRASEVARLVNGRATSLMKSKRQSSLGITEAIWLYSGAPCITKSETSLVEDRRRDADHLRANGKRYLIAEGMLMNGRRVWPGQEPGCKCVSKSVVPGFD